ncbi:MAG TPA: hypothetical protein DD420_36055 [Streptomyces sp.]|nr:hypothetical protein [Streptomyces sp.]
MHASPEARRARMLRCQRVDVGDRNSVEEGFAGRFNSALLHHLGRRHHTVLVFDTEQYTPQEMARQILSVAGLLSEETQRPSSDGFELVGPATPAS